MDSPFNKEENSIGRHAFELRTGFLGGQVEISLNNVLKSQKPNHIKELEFHDSREDITYWDSSIVPIFENGSIKYIFETTTEVTESVLKDQKLENQSRIIKHHHKIEEQNIELNTIIENLSEGVMFVDNKCKFIMINPEAKRLVYQYDIGTLFKRCT